MNSKQLQTWSPWILLAAILLLCQCICSAFEVSELIFPSPTRIASQFWEIKPIIASHTWRTFWVTMTGFGIAIAVGVLIKVGMPRSFPYFYAALKVSITLALVGTTLSEMTAANEGIGYLLISAGSAMLMYEIFSVLERHTTGWAHRGAHNN